MISPSATINNNNNNDDTIMAPPAIGAPVDDDMKQFFAEQMRLCVHKMNTSTTPAERADAKDNLETYSKHYYLILQTSTNTSTSTSTTSTTSTSSTTATTDTTDIKMIPVADTPIFRILSIKETLEFHRNDIRNGINASVHSSIDDFFSSFEKVYNHHVTDTNIDLNWKSSLKTSFKYSSEMVSRWFRKHIAQVRPELHWSQVKQMVRDRFASTALTGTQAVKLASMSLLYKESFKCYVDRFTLNLSALEGIPDYVLAVAMFYNTLPRCIKQSLYSKLKSIKGDDCADHVPGTWKEAVPLFHNLSRTMNPVMDKYYRSFTSIHEYGTTISVGKTLELESHSKKRGSE